MTNVKPESSNLTIIACRKLNNYCLAIIMPKKNEGKAIVICKQNLK
jgi:hypothetical protein